MTYRNFSDIYLCSVADVKQERYGGDANEDYSADDNATIAFYIKQASQVIVNEIMHRLPLPYIATHLFDAPHVYESGKYVGYDASTRYEIPLDGVDLLSVTTFTNGNGNTISASDYVLVSANSYPKWMVRIKNTSAETFDYTTVWEQAISIEGIFGYVPHFGNEWVDTADDLPTGGVTVSATAFTFATAADAADYSEGQYLRLESEYVLVTDANADTGVITIERGVLGSTATIHSAGVDIERFRQHRQVLSSTAKYVSALYNEDRGLYDTGGSTPTIELDNLTSLLGSHKRYTI